MRGGREKRLDLFSVLLKLNSSAIFFYFAAITKLNASLPRIIFHSPTPNFEKFLLISLARLFVLYADEGDFALSLVLTPSFPHQIIAV